jgi:formate hydrogenlyase subunit 6/NADH:ubiquinone oxidoreductase subunit I
LTTSFRLDKAKLGELFAALAAEYRVFGPKRVSGRTRFGEVKTLAELELEPGNTDESAKGIFFPQTETLLTYEGDEARPMSPETKPIALFGARPCDAAGFVVLDRVFGSGRYQDPGWVNRYRDALVVSFGCDVPEPTCFCNWTGLGPFEKEGSDLLLTDIGDSYLIETNSEKGEKFLGRTTGKLTREPTEEELGKAASVQEAAVAAMDAKVDLAKVKTVLDDFWESPFWEEVAEKCLSCAACAYLCPTCHCFDVQDEKAPGAEKGRRVRIWDSCMFPLFTREASGHNSRPGGRGRMRQRIMHKFHYFIENYDRVGCVGCGRCVRSCPVNLGLREMLVRITDGG